MIGIERVMRKVNYFIEREMRKNWLFYWMGKEYMIMSVNCEENVVAHGNRIWKGKWD